MIRQLDALGYWFNDLAPSAYPRPQALVGRWQPARRAAVVRYLRAGPRFESYAGTSFCRFACGVPSRQMGHRDRSDGVWVWPEGLAHYVEAHAVRLPERFIRHAVAHRERLATIDLGRERLGRIDDTRWVAWGRARGAAVALSPAWAVPGWDLQHELERRLELQVTPGHVLWQRRSRVVLWRAATGDAVFRLSSGALAIVRLEPRRRGAPPLRTRLLAGWHAWPAARRG